MRLEQVGGAWSKWKGHENIGEMMGGPSQAKDPRPPPHKRVVTLPPSGHGMLCIDVLHRQLQKMARLGFLCVLWLALLRASIAALDFVGGPYTGTVEQRAQVKSFVEGNLQK